MIESDCMSTLIFATEVILRLKWQKQHLTRDENKDKNILNNKDYTSHKLFALNVKYSLLRFCSSVFTQRNRSFSQFAVIL